ncbi:hypothetical protein QF037_009441 [Streptomyces canus]|nr:hypothetical protein [Streptomyces canus]
MRSMRASAPSISSSDTVSCGARRQPDPGPRPATASHRMQHDRLTAYPQQSQALPARPGVLGDRHLRRPAQRLQEQPVRLRRHLPVRHQVVALRDTDRIDRLQRHERLDLDGLRRRQRQLPQLRIRDRHHPVGCVGGECRRESRAPWRVGGAWGCVSGFRSYRPVTVYEVIAQLPAPEIIRARSKAMAMLGAVLSPEWEFRYHSYDTQWAPSEELASMKDGSGNDYAVVFSESGVYAQATCHESAINAYRARRAAVLPAGHGAPCPAPGPGVGRGRGDGAHRGAPGQPRIGSRSVGGGLVVTRGALRS